MTKIMIRLLKDEDGVTIIEYSLIAALIAMAAITGVTNVGLTVKTFFVNIAAKM